MHAWEHLGLPREPRGARKHQPNNTCWAWPCCCVSTLDEPLHEIVDARTHLVPSRMLPRQRALTCVVAQMQAGKSTPRFGAAFCLLTCATLALLTLYVTSQFVQVKGTHGKHITAFRAAVDESNSRSASGGRAKRYKKLNEHPGCAFLRSNNPTSSNELAWGPYNLCMEQTNDWYQRSRSNCYSCLHPERNVCRDPPMISYHQYLESLHPQRWEGNLLAMKAFLLTQDLRHAHMYLWVPNLEAVYNSNTSAFLDAFSDYITIRLYDYDVEVEGTPWDGDDFFGNGTLVKEYMPAPGSYSDVVRLMLLHKYGGLWMDNDVVLYNDVTHLLATSYQFVMRWMNAHIMYMTAKSPVTYRAMELATTMPLNHPHFMDEIIEKRCKPHGYYQIVASKYGFTDIYNACLLRLLLRFNNSGLEPEATLYDLPLGWWDHDWIGCFKNREAINDTRWHQVATTYLAMHSRHPGLEDSLGPETSPLRRVISITDTFFSNCDHVDCLPREGMPLIAYERLNDRPPAHLRQLLNARLVSESQYVARL